MLTCVLKMNAFWHFQVSRFRYNKKPDTCVMHSSPTSRKLLIEILMAEVKPVVIENYQFEY